MSRFNQDNKSGGRRSSGGQGFGGRGRDMGRPSMHKAVCDECGQTCEVPFRPTGDKPIYCSNCFKGKRGDDSRRSDRPSFGGGDRQDRQMYSAKCSECGNMCEVPFRPTGEKPVYCNTCFDKNKRGGSSDRERNGNKSDGQLREQLNAINNKLDKVLRALGVEVKVEVKEAPKPKIEVPAVVQSPAPVKEDKKVKAAKEVKKVTASGGVPPTIKSSNISGGKEKAKKPTAKKKK